MSRTVASSSTTTATDTTGLSSFFVRQQQQQQRHRDANDNENIEDDEEHQDDDDDQEEENPALISAEIIREAVKNLDKKGKLADYQRRVAIREIKDLIQKSTERNSGLLMKNKTENSYDELKKNIATATTTSSSSSGDEFTSLRQQLGKILNETEQNEQKSASMANQIQSQFWPASAAAGDFYYTPIDLLDIMVVGGGSGCATSDMILDSLTLLHRFWKEYFEEQQQQSQNSSSTTLNDMELTAQWMNILTSFSVPKRIQTQLFNQIKDLPSKIRLLRLMFAISRANSCFPARENFLAKFLETAVLVRNSVQMVKKEIEKNPQNKKEVLRWSPPELFDLAADLLPRIKAWEVAVGFPFFLDEKLLEECGLKIFGGGEEDNFQMMGITSALNKIIQEGDQSDF